MLFNFDVFFSSFDFVLQGLSVTLTYTFLALISGLPLGVILAVMKLRNKGFLFLFAQGYTSIFRGTPLLVQLGLFYFATPQLTGIHLSAFQAGILTFTLNSAAYVSEIFRSGIQSIDKSQTESAKVLGLTNIQIFIHIIFPQTIRKILPSLLNEMIDLLKETALVSTIGEMDIMFRARQVATEKFLYFEPYLLAALFYYVLVFILSSFGSFVERKMQYASH